MFSVSGGQGAFTLHYFGHHPFAGGQFTECWLYDEEQDLIDRASS